MQRAKVTANSGRQGFRATLKHFLTWAAWNVVLALAQVFILVFVLWCLQSPVVLEKVLENAVLLFFSLALLGNAAYVDQESPRREVGTTVVTIFIAFLATALYILEYLDKACLLRVHLNFYHILPVQIVVVFLAVTWAWRVENR